MYYVCVTSGPSLLIESTDSMIWYIHVHASLIHLRIFNTHSMQGKLKYNEHITEGFDNMFDAFLGLFMGDNTGKAIIKP